MKTILVLGSKPGAEFPPYDVAICANAAGSFYKKQLEKKGNYIETVVAASELIKSKRPSEEKEKWLFDKFNRITKTDTQNLIVIGAEHFPECVARLNAAKVEQKCKFLTTNDFSNLFYKYTDRKTPLLTHRHVKLIISGQWSILKTYLLDRVKQTMKANHLCHSLFRQGTGANALLYAIDKYGPNAKYYVSGIGKTQRETYADGSINVWTPTNRVNTNHVLADVFLFDKLNGKFEIEYDENTFF